MYFIDWSSWVVVGKVLSLPRASEIVVVTAFAAAGGDWTDTMSTIDLQYPRMPDLPIYWEYILSYAAFLFIWNQKWLDKYDETVNHSVLLHSDYDSYSRYSRRILGTDPNPYYHTLSLKLTRFSTTQRTATGRLTIKMLRGHGDQDSQSFFSQRVLLKMALL